MTKKQQAARAKELQRLLDNLNALAELSPLKGKALNYALSSYVSGWSNRTNDTPDPIIYIAILRGGDPRKEIEAGIKLITPNKNKRHDNRRI